MIVEDLAADEVVGKAFAGGGVHDVDPDVLVGQGAGSG
jgi:hypothetical protein